MKRTMLILSSLIIGLMSGCSEDNPIVPIEPVEDWTFPSSTSKFAVTILGTTDPVSPGGSFDLKVVVYNVTDLFGAGFEVSYPSDRIEITDVVSGPHFAPANQLLIVKKIEQSADRVSYGVTFVAGSNHVANGSGVIFKLRCKARALGSGIISFNTQKLELRRPDGTMISNFAALQKEDFMVTIR